MKASKMRASPSLMSYSGCHCTPMQNLLAGMLDALDHAVGRHRVDDHVRADILHRLVMGAVDLQMLGARRSGAGACSGISLTPWPGLGARVRLLMGERAVHLVGDMLDQACRRG